MRSFRAVLAAILAFGSLASCETNPAGRSVFTGLMSSGEEQRLGMAEHPKVVQEFGGEHEDPKIRAYVNELGQKLAAQSEMPELKWTFTVLNSDIVNAFAIPGGFIYITSGLMALANNEAELAGVIGHEIGHVTARHTAERYSQAVAAQIGLGVLGVATGGVGQDLAEFGAVALLSSYSRDQESEADSLGIRYLTKAAYDPLGMSSFLSSLEAQSQLENKLAGSTEGDKYNLMSTHPRTAVRVRDAALEARKASPVANPRIGALDYLKHIEGLNYGGDRDNGFVRNREFVHPKLRIRFEVPKGFNIFNGPTQVAALGPNKAQIIFDMTPKGTGDSARAYLAHWGQGLRLSNIESIKVSGLDAATGSSRVSTRSGQMDVRLVAIRLTPKIYYRFIMVSPPSRTAALNEEFQRTTYSFKVLTQEEADKAQPYRVRLYLTKPGETAEQVAAQLPYDEFKLERFLVLNGFKSPKDMKPNQLVKLVND